VTWHRYRSRPWGINGGKESKDGNYSLIQSGQKKEKVYSRSNQDLNIGDVCSNRTNGGAGYGDPLDRDPVLVQEDVLDGYISVKSAHEDYGVVIDEKTNSVDLNATKRLREEKRRNGGE
jgi:N-methylhydantoinase B